MSFLIPFAEMGGEAAAGAEAVGTEAASSVAEPTMTQEVTGRAQNFNQGQQDKDNKRQSMSQMNETIMQGIKGA
jgi:hypothetical protein